ncbi:MAG: c-type cytochrome [Thermoanaerobaculia bacterium]|nr:c-type cytochrome [Thermoanaerobaculia bacterium]
MFKDIVHTSAFWLALLAMVAGIFVVINNLRNYRLKLEQRSGVQEKWAPQVRSLRRMHWLLELLITVIGGVSAWYFDSAAEKKVRAERLARLTPVFDPNKFWVAPDPVLAQLDPDAKLIEYGRDLIVHTQDYFGPEGLVRPGSINGLNCQSCHLDAGAKPFGNNYFAVQSTYPLLRARSGTLETIPKRVNDCFERSLNGQPLDTASREMRAIAAYIRYLGSGVPKDAKPRGTGLLEVPFPDRAADPAKGQAVYAAKCASCHGADGQGLPMPGSARNYPPLWGEDSYNEAAGLFRLSRFAGYVKANMPFGASHDNPQLTDEEAWDVAAFVNSQPRPKHPFLDQDWPDISKKPFDHPFGPFKDTFPEQQHKFGPFAPIVAFYKK